MNLTRTRAASRPAMGVELDSLGIDQGLVSLRPYDHGGGRDHWAFLSVFIDLHPTEGRFRVTSGVQDEEVALFSLENAIANAVFRCASILETTPDDLPLLAAEIRQLIAKLGPEVALATSAT